MRTWVFNLMCTLSGHRTLSGHNTFPLAAFLGTDKELVKKAAEDKMAELKDNGNTYEVVEVLIVEFVGETKDPVWGYSGMDRICP
jgi:hypothetical protein